MARYILKRLLWIIPVMLGVLLIVFTISYLAPGDPVRTALGSGYTEERYLEKQIELGLDKPFWVQLWNYIVGIVTRFDFGKSYVTNISVSSEIMHRLPITIGIGLLGVILTMIIGIPFGMVSALKQYSIYDYSVTVLSLLCAAIPNFVAALLLILLFCVNLNWLPVTGLDTWKSWILPVISNSIAGVAVVTRMSRTSILEVVRQDYIRTARAKGIEERRVIRKHVLTNALIPIITVVGGQMCTIVAGSIIIETIFSIPGLGMYLYSGISNRDYPIINGCVLLIAFFVCVMNLLTDLAYAAVDPRIKAQYQTKKKKAVHLAENAPIGED
ncbi:MAG: ABC transporter permease [Oscillospiraceae bacterium]|nr:ABC transporter permease [Oscillospiraceae bacterium]